MRPRWGGSERVSGKLLRCSPSDSYVEYLRLGLTVSTQHPGISGYEVISALYAEGRYSDAERLASDATAPNGQSGLAWKLLGMARVKQGKDGLAALRVAARLLPLDFDAQLFFGYALCCAGEHTDALQPLDRALRIAPDNAEANFHRGHALEQLGRWAEAEPSYRRALSGNPGNAETCLNLGVVLRRLDRPDEAMDAFRHAITRQPDFAQAWVNLGYDLCQSGLDVDASACYREAMRHAPELSVAHLYLAVAQRKLGQTEAAISSFRRAAELAPDDAEALFQLSGMLLDLSRAGEALSTLECALQRRPQRADLHLLQGSVLQQLGESDKAFECFSRAVELQPDLPNAQSNYLFAGNYQVATHSAKVLAMAKRYGERIVKTVDCYTQWPNTADSDKPLRVGLVSGDFCDHSVGHFLENVLGAMDTRRIVLYGYSTEPRGDAVTIRLRSHIPHWREVGALTDRDLAEQIRTDGIDLLVDLSGHTAGNRLPVFAAKPAPVQVSWLGYLGSTGVKAIDYLVADPCVLPTTDEANFTEKIWHLPETYVCFTRPEFDVEVAALPAMANGYLTFGSFNNLIKMNDGVVALWARVLVAVPGSRLLLKARQLNNVSAQLSTLERFRTHGIESSRLILEGPVHERSAHLTTYERVDIALDPFPYTGVTTSVEALWMGVPVLTLAGDRFLSRQGVGLLTNAGLPEWIATDPEHYVALAKAYAGDTQRLTALRKTLREKLLVSPIFDAPRFARHFETALRGMWNVWCDRHRG